MFSNHQYIVHFRKGLKENQAYNTFNGLPIKSIKPLMFDNTYVIDLKHSKNRNETLVFLKNNFLIKHIEKDLLIENDFYTKKIEEKIPTKEEIKKFLSFPNSNFSPNEKSIVVAVIDTGIKHDHPYFKSKLVIDINNNKTIYGYNFSEDNKEDFYNVEDSYGHGTHVAGIISSNFETAKILIIKLFKDKISSISKACDAMLFAANKGAVVINNSWKTKEKCVGDSLYFKNTMLKLKQKKCIPVFAAGNYTKNVLDVFPQKLDNIIVVGSLNYNYQRSEDSCYGKKIDVWAPGENITSASLSKYEVFVSGTSQATPFVTGAIAVLKAQNINLNIDEIKEILKIKPTYKIDKEPFYAHLLNIKGSLNKINLKNKIMLKKITVPKTPNQVNKHVKPFVHVEDSSVFQLIHTDYNYFKQETNFQILARFFGETVYTRYNDTPKFLIKQIDFTLVNLNTEVKCIDKIEIHLKDNEDIEFEIETKEGAKKDVDFSYKTPFVINHNQVIDCNVDGDAQTKNGIPCRSIIHIGTGG